MAAENQIAIEPIGLVRSCFTEKFGIPRQSGLLPAAVAEIELHPPYDREELWRGLTSFSHVWLHFLFHKTVADGWRSTVRPPRLGGKKRVGIFASRSPHRPNHLGLSVVRLLAVHNQGGHCRLEVAGVDILDRSPVVDIKPYLPYCDRVMDAQCREEGYRDDRLDGDLVEMDEAVHRFCGAYRQQTGRNLGALIREIVSLDPRPASQRGGKEQFGMLLWDINVRWRVVHDGAVLRIIVDSCERIRVR